MLAGPVHQLPMAQFRPLSGAELPEVPPDVLSGLSKDLHLLLECASAVASGNGTAVAHRQHGKLNMARWHTAQSRLLRVYMSEQCPSDDLTTLAVYVVTVYVPAIMSIRHQPDLVEAPKHLYNQLERQRRHLSGVALDTVQQSVRRNGYMAHPEAVLLAMLGDDDDDVRHQAVQLVQGGTRAPKAGQGQVLQGPRT
ncbi:hypothetical protein FJT64_009680 [Amphibalanus amphitrite]|uniref:Uncharacterized protein n=1 Tax=Amphibalanus amphitrite TaxID=1232801 RepID=A0A6A4VSP5_AMPAM|nr:hypothetical protein FJT64_009680 [Amphibalanus amphitrite]